MPPVGLPTQTVTAAIDASEEEPGDSDSAVSLFYDDQAMLVAPPKETSAKKGQSLADRLSCDEPCRKKQRLRAIDDAVERVRKKRFAELSDTQWREMVDKDGVKLHAWVAQCVTANRQRNGKFGPSQHKEALRRWQIRRKASSDLPPAPMPDEGSVVDEKKLTQAIAKFREKNPAMRSQKPLAKFFNETDELSAYLLYGLICEIEIDEIVVKDAHRLLVAKVLKWMARKL